MTFNIMSCNNKINDPECVNAFISVQSKPDKPHRASLDKTWMQ